MAGIRTLSSGGNKQNTFKLHQHSFHTAAEIERNAYSTSRRLHVQSSRAPAYSSMRLARVSASSSVRRSDRTLSP
jgi:hypothetical protein